MDRDVLPLIPPYLPDQQYIFQQDKWRSTNLHIL